MTYDEMSPTRLDLTGTFGLRVAGRDAAEVRIGTAGRWGQRVNLATRPRASSVSPTGGPGDFSRHRYSSQHSNTAVTGLDTPVSGVTTAARITTTAASYSGGWFFSGNPDAATPGSAYPTFTVTAGQTISFSMWVLAARAGFPTQPIPLDTRAAISADTWAEPKATTTINVPTGEWTRVRYLSVIPAAATRLHAAINWSAGSLNTVGDSVTATALLIEDVTHLAAQWSALPDPKPTLDAWLDDRLGSAYFDGDTESTREALHHWTATPHASTSVQTLAWTPGD